MSEEEINRFAADLRKELGLTYDTGAIGVGKDEWFVIIYANVRKPPLVKWHGWPVRYHIGGGMAVALGAAA